MYHIEVVSSICIDNRYMTKMLYYFKTGQKKRYKMLRRMRRIYRSHKIVLVNDEFFVAASYKNERVNSFLLFHYLRYGEIHTIDLDLSEMMFLN